MTSSATAEMPPMPLQATKADDLEADLKSKLQVDFLKFFGSTSDSDEEGVF